MSDNVIDLSQHKDKARYKKQEKAVNDIRDQFERAAPTQSPKKKLLDIFKKKR